MTMINDSLQYAKLAQGSILVSRLEALLSKDFQTDNPIVRLTSVKHHAQTADQKSVGQMFLESFGLPIEDDSLVLTVFRDRNSSRINPLLETEIAKLALSPNPASPVFRGPTDYGTTPTLIDMTLEEIVDELLDNPSLISNSVTSNQFFLLGVLSEPLLFYYGTPDTVRPLEMSDGPNTEKLKVTGVSGSLVLKIFGPGGLENVSFNLDADDELLISACASFFASTAVTASTMKWALAQPPMGLAGFTPIQSAQPLEIEVYVATPRGWSITRGVDKAVDFTTFEDFIMADFTPIP